MRGDDMTTRLTAERLAEIRAIADERMRFRDDGGFVTHSEMDLVLLVTHLDAVTAERDLYDQRLAAAAVVLEAFERSLGVEIGRQLDGNFTTRNP
jgi:hypothetical protein